MYSWKQRMAAVELVLAECLSEREVVGRLGYPKQPVTVSAWVREYLERGGLHFRYGDGSLVPTVFPNAGEADDMATREEVEELEARKRQLEREIKQAELQLAVRRKAVELLGKGTGAAPENELTNREKAILVRDLAGPDMRQADLLREVGLARSTYNDQLRAMGAPEKYAGLRGRIAAIFGASGGTYGYRRVKSALAADGTTCSEKVVARIMAQEGLVAKRSNAGRRRWWSSYEGETPGAPPNLVGRDFRSALPNFLWLTDISEFSIPAGKLYLSAIVDCFDVMLVSWAVSEHPDKELANGTLLRALARREGWEATVIHSDRGGHYRWNDWIAICEENGIVHFMSRLGCSPDNSAMEGFFGRMKVEMFYGEDWSRATLADLAREIDAYMCWYNSDRIKLSLDGLSPVQFRRSLGFAA